MKIIRPALFLLIVLLGICAAQSGAPSQSAQPPKDTKQPFSLAIRLPHESVRAGLPVDVEVTIKNATDGLLFLDRNWLGSFDVRDSKGRQPLTRRGEIILKHAPLKPGEVRDLPTGGGPPLQLSPQETVTVNLVVDNLFDLSQPGKYTILVHLPDGAGGGGVVKSNAVTVTVVPSQSQ